MVQANVGRTRDWYNKNPGVIRDPHVRPTQAAPQAEPPAPSYSLALLCTPCTPPPPTSSALAPTPLSRRGRHHAPHTLLPRHISSCDCCTHQLLHCLCLLPPHLQGPREDSGFSSGVDPGVRLAAQARVRWLCPCHRLLSLPHTTCRAVVVLCSPTWQLHWCFVCRPPVVCALANTTLPPPWCAQVYTYAKKFHPNTQVMASGLRTKDGAGGGGGAMTTNQHAHARTHADLSASFRHTAPSLYPPPLPPPPTNAHTHAAPAVQSCIMTRNNPFMTIDYPLQHHISLQLPGRPCGAHSVHPARTYLSIVPQTHCHSLAVTTSS